MCKAVLKLKPVKRPAFTASIDGLQEHDISNIQVALRTLIDELAPGQQRQQCEDLRDSLKLQLAYQLKNLMK